MGKGEGGELSIGATGQKRSIPCGYEIDKGLKKRERAGSGIPNQILFNVYGANPLLHSLHYLQSTALTNTVIIINSMVEVRTGRTDVLVTFSWSQYRQLSQIQN